MSMRQSRRMKRMERSNKNHFVRLNLIPMLDVLSVLVFFLLFHSFNGDMPEQHMALPQSVVETKPRGTVAISVTPDAVLIQGEPVMKTNVLYDERVGTVPEVIGRLAEIQRSMENEPGGKPIEGQTREITLLADKTIPFNVLKKIMTSCTASGYGKISLAVIQKAPQHG